MNTIDVRSLSDEKFVEYVKIYKYDTLCDPINNGKYILLPLYDDISKEDFEPDYLNITSKQFYADVAISYIRDSLNGIPNASISDVDLNYVFFSDSDWIHTQNKYKISFEEFRRSPFFDAFDSYFNWEGEYYTGHIIDDVKSIFEFIELKKPVKLNEVIELDLSPNQNKLLKVKMDSNLKLVDQFGNEFGRYLKKFCKTDDFEYINRRMLFLKIFKNYDLNCPIVNSKRYDNFFSMQYIDFIRI